ncbi:MAG: hypothetical protein U1F76_22010 [Candidatus Competibacteraceae bacterium]
MEQLELFGHLVSIGLPVGRRRLRKSGRPLGMTRPAQQCLLLAGELDENGGLRTPIASPCRPVTTVNAIEYWSDAAIEDLHEGFLRRHLELLSDPRVRLPTACAIWAWLLEPIRDIRQYGLPRPLSLHACCLVLGVDPEAFRDRLLWKGQCGELPHPRRLQAQFLEQRLQQLCDPRCSRQVIARVWDWILAPSPSTGLSVPFSFSACCAACRRDPDTYRDNLLQQVRTGELLPPPKVARQL